MTALFIPVHHVAASPAWEAFGFTVAIIAFSLVAVIEWRGRH